MFRVAFLKILKTERTDQFLFFIRFALIDSNF